MEGYYDSEPTHRLPAFLSLVSILNPLSRSVGKRLAALTGTPLVVLDEAVEHRFGASAHRLVTGQGLEAWRSAESAELRLAVKSRPFAFLVLGEGVLSDRSNRALVAAETDLLYLYQPLDEVQEIALTRPETGHVTLWTEARDIPGSPAERLEAMFAIRDSEYKTAEMRVDCTHRSVHRISMELLERLERRGTLMRL